MGFIFLALFNGALVFIQVRICCKALHFLLDQVTIRHRVADGSYFVAHFHEYLGNFTGRLTLTGTCAHGAHSNDWLRGFYLRAFCAHYKEICTQRIDLAGFMHYIGVRHIAIGKNNFVNIKILNQLG